MFEVAVLAPERYHGLAFPADLAGSRAPGVALRGHARNGRGGRSRRAESSAARSWEGRARRQPYVVEYDDRQDRAENTKCPSPRLSLVVT